MIVDKSDKLIKYEDKFKLYDLKNDSDEVHDIADENEEIVKRLKDKI